MAEAAVPFHCSLKDCLAIAHATSDAPGGSLIQGLAALEHAGPEDLAFFSPGGHLKRLQATGAGYILTTEEHAPDCPEGAVVLCAANPLWSFAQLAREVEPSMHARVENIHPTAIVPDSCELADDVRIGPYCVLGERVVMGKGAVLHASVVCGNDVFIGEHTSIAPQVTIYSGVHIGRRCLIHAQSVIGSDGFGFVPHEGAWSKVPQIGAVRIGDDVEIGASTTIDRGTLHDTVIEQGVKLDNQIQIAHNVRVGQHTVIAAGTGIAGSTEIGQRCLIGGHVGIVGHLKLTDGVAIQAVSRVTNSITKSGQYSSGTALLEAGAWRKNAVHMKHLDRWIKRIQQLEKKHHE